jgi:hypothetical protein
MGLIVVKSSNEIGLRRPKGLTCDEITNTRMINFKTKHKMIKTNLDELQKRNNQMNPSLSSIFKYFFSL